MKSIMDTPAAGSRHSLFRRILTALRYRRWHRFARQQAARLGCRIYAVKINGHPTLVTRSMLKAWRAKGFMHRSFTSASLAAIALFFVDPPKHK